MTSRSSDARRPSGLSRSSEGAFAVLSTTELVEIRDTPRHPGRTLRLVVPVSVRPPTAGLAQAGFRLNLSGVSAPACIAGAGPR